MKKLFLSMVLVCGILVSGFAQNNKTAEKAQEKVEELNAEIVAGNPDLALSKEQASKIKELHIKRISEAQKLRKSDAEQEEIKAINQKYFKQIFQEILTKEQRQARRKAKE